MWDIALPVLYAAFVWWFATGVILLLVGRPRWTYGWSMAGATVLLMVALGGVTISGAMTDERGAYLGFTAAILAWGWLEMAFLMGFVTGRRPPVRSEPAGSWRHFVDAIAAIIDHELSLIAGAVVVIGLSWGQPNQVAAWTFLALWGMRQSAKLNLHFGVRNLNDELLPPHLQHLRIYLRRRTMNPLFPVSIAIGTAICALVAARAVGPASDSFEAVGLTLLATMLALGVFEHWMMILPLPVNDLWRWSLRGRGSNIEPASSGAVSDMLSVSESARVHVCSTPPAWQAARRRTRSDAPIFAGRTRRPFRAPWRP
ncbi:putative photosynthetic complex assembly protein 2 [Dongia mobilis]|uniref:Putative photosynthetic complex assembly protein 2 n=1 Tax=Dongia mobilis TaxID=578943 RepID=A0A4R6WV57_9PROT|nr:putative photosynthetic complex assembly protein PuhE [Dongia mobilis]TDQ82962.1 putative photosynthetic complex assembly protein 2 [Dongia mobilis]